MFFLCKKHPPAIADGCTPIQIINYVSSHAPSRFDTTVDFYLLVYLCAQLQELSAYL